MNEIIFLLLMAFAAAMLVLGLNIAININISLHAWADTDYEFMHEEQAAHQRALRRAQYNTIAINLNNKETR